MYHFLCLFLLSFSWWMTISINLLYAQLNDFGDTLKWNYRMASGINYSSGNVKRFFSRTDLTLKHVNEAWGIASHVNYLYGTFGNFKTENDVINKNFIYLYPKKRTYLYLMGWMESSFRRRFDFRYQVGPGFSHLLLKKEKNLLKASLTFTYETTWFWANARLNDPEITNRRVNVPRITGRLSGHHSFGDSGFRLNYELWFQQSLLKTRNYRYYIDASLDYKFHKHVSLNTKINLSHEELTVIPLQKTDLYWVIGLSVGK